jgi:hypothetical protein
MSRTMNVSVVVDLRERASRGLDALGRRFDRLRALADRASQAAGRALAAAQRTVAVGGAITALAGGLTFVGAIQSAAALDARLRDVAIQAGAVGREVDASVLALQRRFAALEIRTGQAGDQIAAAYLRLVQAGMSPAQADAMIGPLSRSVVALGTEFGATGGAVRALQRDMGLTADQIEGAFGRIMAGARLANVQVGGLVGDIPKIAQALGQLGIRGPDALGRVTAMIAAARRAGGTDEQARSSVLALIEGAAGREAEERWQNAGIDLPAMMRDADRRGIQRFDAIVRAIQRYTGLDASAIGRALKRAELQGLTPEQAMDRIVAELSASRVGEKLEQLMGGRDGMRALVAAIADVQRLNRETAAANTDPTGVFERAYADRLRLFGVTMQRVGAISTQLRNRMGLAFGQMAGEALPHLERLLDAIAGLDQRLPGVVDGLIQGAGALLVFATTLGVVGLAVPLVVKGFGVLANAAKLLFGPLGLLAALVFFVWWNWDRLSAGIARVANGAWSAVGGAINWLAGLLKGDFAQAAHGARGMWEGLSEIVRGAGDILRNVAKVFDEAITWILHQVDRLAGTNLAQAWEGFKAGVSDALDAARTAVTEWTTWFLGLPDRILGALGTLDLAGWIRSAVAGAQAVIDEWVTWFATLPRRIIEAIGAIDLSNLIRWPSMPSWFGGGSGGAQPATPAPPGPGSGLGRQGFAPVTGSTPQLARAEVGGRIDVRVTGPAQVTSTTSTNRNVPISADRGAVTDRV